MTDRDKLIDGVRALKDKLDANFELDGALPLTWADVRSTVTPPDSRRKTGRRYCCTSQAVKSPQRV
jgi:hypothetical protein